MREILYSFCLSFVLLPFSLQAEDHIEKVDSVVFNKDQPAEVDEETSIKIETSEKTQHCYELMKEADSLKGKPLRRSAALQRYELECSNNRD